LGKGIKPPRTIYAPEPEFSDPARVLRYQGTLTLGVTVNQEGFPTHVRILSPLGCGLDEKAVDAVQRWRFQPAEKDGQPVSVTIAVETIFHLY
jgi:periplasmic protein TonB